MRRSTTVKALARREAVLISFLAAAAAAAALAGPLGASWLRAVGAILAVMGAAARTVIALQRARVERRQERADADRRLLVPAAAVGTVDPTAVGIDPAAQTILAGGALPAYVARGVDEDLRGALTAAIDGTGPWLVVAVGASKVGKSRSLFEGLRGCPAATGLEFVAPADRDALLALLAPEQGLARKPQPAVLWLDDLEPFLNQGLTLPRLREWRADRAGRIVVGTYGGKGSELIAGTSVSGLATVAAEILGHAREVPLRATTDAELGPLRGKLSPVEFDTIQRHGLAAYLVAGPVLERKLTTGRHAPGDQRCPEGEAVVYAAVDWARCGRTDPIGHDLLRQLWPAHLPAASLATDEAYETGLAWALRPVAATIALLYEVGSYRAYDYVIRLVRDRADPDPPSEQTWAAAIDTAVDTQASSVAVAAYQECRLDLAVAAFRRAGQSTIPQVGATATNNLGVVLGELGRPGEAIQAYDAVAERYSADPTPALREQVATALVNKGVALGALGRSDEELEAYDAVAERYSTDPTPALRAQVAMALVNKGLRLDPLGRPDEAIQAYDAVAERYSTDPTPALRALVAKALVNKGVALGALGRSDEELEAYDAVAERYSTDPTPALREQVAKALLRKGDGLGALGRSDEELEAYDAVAERYSTDPTPALREQVATALVRKGVALGELERPGEAIQAYDAVAERYSTDPTPALRAQVATALVNKGVALGALGRSDEELGAYDAVAERYGADPALRAQVAQALVNKTVRLGALGRSDDELEAYDALAERYSTDPTPALRELVATALVKKGLRLGALGRSDEAIQAYDAVAERYGADPESGVQKAVQDALELRQGLNQET